MKKLIVVIAVFSFPVVYSGQEYNPQVYINNVLDVIERVTGPKPTYADIMNNRNQITKELKSSFGWGASQDLFGPGPSCLAFGDYFDNCVRYSKANQRISNALNIMASPGKQQALEAAPEKIENIKSALSKQTTPLNEEIQSYQNQVAGLQNQVAALNSAAQEKIVQIHEKIASIPLDQNSSINLQDVGQIISLT